MKFAEYNYLLGVEHAGGFCSASGRKINIDSR